MTKVSEGVDKALQPDQFVSQTLNDLTQQHTNTLSVWDGVQAQLKKKLSAPSFETWISPLMVVAIQPDRLILQATSAFNRDWINKNYRQALETAFQHVLGWETMPVLELTVAEDPTQADQDAAVSAILAEQPAQSVHPKDLKGTWTPRTQVSQLNPKYTFENFVVGNHNRFCYAAALAVAENPAQSYNPLFIYGGVGLGKTHLMQAIGHFVQQHQPEQKVRYVTTEQFTNELITSLGNKDMKNFQDRYRRINVLIIDDIQFLEGKDRTQEEFFHTFNTLHQAGKQIILSSDRAPERLSQLENRLRSRFSWGLIADIQQPDFETRVAILQRKAQQNQLKLSDDVLQYMAETYPANIRELEGALNKVSAYRMLTGCYIDLAQAQTLLGKRFDPNRISQNDILETVAHYYHLQRADLQSPLRTKHIAHARQIAIYVVRELTEASFPQIGNLLGGRRHTTILYAYEKIKELMAVDLTLRQQIQEMMDIIKNKVS